MDKILTVPNRDEVIKRIQYLHKMLCGQHKEWDAIFLVDRVNHYYFTGTMQNGIFVLMKDGTYAYFVKKSIERAKAEGVIDNIYPMKSYKDMLNVVGNGIKNIFIETEIVTAGTIERLKKYFAIENIYKAEDIIFNIRAVKSEYELNLIKESGRQHSYLFESIIPSLFKEGMTEAEFAADLIKEMILLGYHGRAKLYMFQADIMPGQIGFGTNSLYPTSFDGPGGMKGMHPAAPVVGDRFRRLRKGDFVFVDFAYGVNGYHTDRTQTYMFGASPSEEMADIHKICLGVQKEAAQMLKPGNIPSQIYEAALSGLDNNFLQHFMGYKDEKVKFLGHGIGLHVDEYPVIAKGFDEPLKENMVVALEPKRALDGVGLIGTEDTYIVTKDGGKCVTGGEKDIFVL